MMRQTMTPDEYRTAIASLGLSQVGAARLLGVSQKTGHNYAVHGPSGPAALALRLLLTMRADERPEWLPFDVRTPNATTRAALDAAERGEVTKVESFDALLADLND